MATKYQHSSGTVVEGISTFRVALDGTYVDCTVYIDSEAQYHVATTVDFKSVFTIYEPTYEYQVLSVINGEASLLTEYATEEEAAAVREEYRTVPGFKYVIIPETKRIRA